MSTSELITREEALSRLHYDPQTGALTWISASPRMARIIGRPAGRVQVNGYWYVNVKGKLYASHRLIWLMHYGHWPRQQIDHIDGVRTNNSIANLRDVDAKTNARNRHGARKDCGAGTPGVYEQDGRWYAYTYIDGAKKSLGGYSSIESAIAARADFKRNQHHVE